MLGPRGEEVVTEAGVVVDPLATERRTLGSAALTGAVLGEGERV